MLQPSDKPQVFTGKGEEPLRRIRIQFDRAAFLNALRDELWCPLAQRLAAAREPACIKQIEVLCETEAEALKTANYHFYSTGSNFKILSNEPNIN